MSEREKQDLRVLAAKVCFGLFAHRQRHLCGEAKMGMLRRMKLSQAVLVFLLVMVSRGTFAASESADVPVDTTTFSDANSFPSPIPMMQEQGSTDDIVVPENVQQPQVRKVNSNSWETKLSTGFQLSLFVILMND